VDRTKRGGANSAAHLPWGGAQRSIWVESLPRKKLGSATVNCRVPTPVCPAGGQACRQTRTVLPHADDAVRNRAAVFSVCRFAMTYAPVLLWMSRSACINQLAIHRIKRRRWVFREDIVGFLHKRGAQWRTTVAACPPDRASHVLGACSAMPQTRVPMDIMGGTIRLGEDVLNIRATV